jgi:Ca2+-binding EF-hand superfamily protein
MSLKKPKYQTSLETRFKLLRVILLIAENDIQVEDIRQKIAVEFKFWPKLVFDRFISPDPFDQKDKFVDIDDMLRFMQDQLKAHDVAVDPANYGLYQLMRIFDYNNDGYLDFDDFMLIILP